MSNHNQTMLPSARSGRAIYDAIMARIEPELAIAELPLLQERFEGEDAEQRSCRSARWRRAFAEYDHAYKQHMSDLKKSGKAERRESRTTAEKASRAEESQIMSELQSDFAS